MDSWRELGYGSPGEYMRDRFYDEVELDRPEPSECGGCGEWTRCPIEGHRSVGWCARWREFFDEHEEACE